MVSEPSLVSKLEPSPITESVPRRTPLHPRQIPWGYGRDRLTATPVDPERLFLYWEVRDESIDAARERLGPAGARAALVMRIYDTSGRICDGDNAHASFDQDIQRGDRQWFCTVGKPASSAHVEFGLRTPDGRFLKLVRSGRVDFPRKDPAGGRPPEWMRVVANTGDIASRETSTVNGFAGGADSGADFAGGAGVIGGGGEGALEAAIETLTSTESFESVEFDSYELKEYDVERYETDTGWQVDPVDPGAVYRMVTMSWQEVGLGVSAWESGPSESSWEAGPFSYPTEVIVPAVERYEGTPHVWRSGEQVRVMHGPWQVVIRGINAQSSRRVLARWEVHRSWVGVSTRSAEAAANGSLGETGFIPGGSSERFLAASDLRLRGASEVFFLGASERRLGGASELRFLAASQWIARGASERLLKGASEWRLSGASELRLMGGSERRLAGASERHYTGASERRLRMGASEARLGGASEARLGGASEVRLSGNFPPAPSRKG
jgi:hypothetical protein